MSAPRVLGSDHAEVDEDAMRLGRDRAHALDREMGEVDLPVDALLLQNPVDVENAEVELARELVERDVEPATTHGPRDVQLGVLVSGVERIGVERVEDEDVGAVYAEGRYLNDELLKKGLAERM